MSLDITTFRVNQNNQGFLIGIFKMSELRKFVKFTRNIVIDFDEENKPIYNKEVQRKISPTKVDAIANFLIHDTDAFFPTNIVLSVPAVAIQEIKDSGDQAILSLHEFVEKENKKEEGYIYLTIIDGQHRIAGIEKAIKRIKDRITILEATLRSSSEDKKEFQEELKEKYSLLKRLENFEIVVTFFIDPTLEYQAMVFSTINRTQTKVSEDLVYSLFGLSKSDSPQKTALEVVLALNASEKSALYNRIKISGASYSAKSVPPLSQTTAVKSILFQISPNLREAEIEKNKLREYVLKHSFQHPLIFRRYYGENNDAQIIKMINTFFKAVQDSFKDENGFSYWKINAVFNILHTTIGFQALFLIFVELVIRGREDQITNYQYYYDELIKAKDLDVVDNNDPKTYPLTSKSINKIYNFIGEKIWKEKFVAKEIKE